VLSRTSASFSFLFFNRIRLGFLVWIVVGLIAGWLAGQVMKGGGYGVLVDIFSASSAASWAAGSSGFWESGRVAE
jgi:uncharacterized membrane protein YeaQ/YmgE (transglycosylase-associated protein family)